MTPAHLVDRRLFRGLDTGDQEALAVAIRHVLEGGVATFMTAALTTFADAHLMVNLLMARKQAGSLRGRRTPGEIVFESAARGQLRITLLGPV